MTDTTKADQTLRHALASVARVLFASGYPGNHAQLAGAISGHGDGAFTTPNLAHQPGAPIPASERSATTASAVLDELDFLND